MTKILLTAAAFGLSLSAANACNLMRSAEAKVDPAVVASVAADDANQMSTQQQTLPTTAPVETTEEPAQ